MDETKKGAARSHVMTPEFEFVSCSEEQTERLGLLLAQVLRPGITVALNGDLGSGKTRLVRAVCRALGADENRVNSPTFVLLQAYMDGELPVYHFDTYRLADVDEFLAIGADEYFNDPDAVCFVEWADRFAEALPEDRVTIRIEQTGESERIFRFAAHGPVTHAIMATLQTRLRTPES